MPPSSTTWFKPALWTLLAALTLSVIFWSEITMLRIPQEQASLLAIRWLIIPHVIAGITAFITGPFNFSSRLRARNLKRHRILGRIYVFSVFTSAPFAVAVVLSRHVPDAIFFYTANIVQATAWFLATAGAFVTARNRQIQQHREWMVRSYALTFTFVMTRVFKPFALWNNLGRPGTAIAIIIITFASVFVVDIGLHWRAFTTRRA